MPTIRFTDIGLRSLPEGLYFDERTPAFGIRVGKTRKTWVVLKEPNRTKLRIGHYPDLSLADARKKALVAIGSPLQDRAIAPTFPEARIQFLKQGNWRASTRQEITRNLTKHFSWREPIDKISHRDVAEVIDRIGGKSQAAHAFKDLRAFFNWCVPRYLKISPCQGLKPPPQNPPRARVLTDDELRAVWKASVEYGYPFGDIVRLLILTGQRRGEIAALRREWLHDNAIVFPPEITKNAREHVLPVGEMTLSILTPTKNEGLLFPARRSEFPFNGFGASKEALNERCGVSQWTLHDLRRTFATNLAALGTPIHVTEKLLNHVSGSTGGIVSIYQRHSYMDEMRSAVLAWEARLKAIIGAT
jgi:integrase